MHVYVHVINNYVNNYYYAYYYNLTFNHTFVYNSIECNSVVSMATLFLCSDEYHSFHLIVII